VDDVTVDLCDTQMLPALAIVKAFAIGRDVDVLGDVTVRVTSTRH